MANRLGMRRGGSRSELGIVGAFIPCRSLHGRLGGWSRPKLSTVCCLRRSEVVVLKYVATLNVSCFCILWPKCSFIKQTVANSAIL